MRPENAEFAGLLRAAEWNQAEAGRRLGLSRATISRYFSDEIPPSKTVLELFKLILLNQKPGMRRGERADREPPIPDFCFLFSQLLLATAHENSKIG